MAVVALEGMQFFAHHGLYEEEKVHGNHFEVDVEVDCGQRAVTDSESIGDTVDYVEIYRIVQRVMEERVDLLETLVSRIGSMVLAAFPEVASVRVKVAKLNPPVGGPCLKSTVQHVFMGQNAG